VEGGEVKSPKLGRTIGQAILILIGGALLISQVSPTANQGFEDGAAVLAMVSLLALGIERVIEVFWTLMSSFKNGWWPLGALANAVNQVVDDTNAAVTPVFDTALDGLNDTRRALERVGKDLTAVDAEIAKVQDQKVAYAAQLHRISSLGQDNQRVQLVTTTAFQAVNRLDAAYGSTMPKLRGAINDANQVATGASDLLGAIKDNPAKKVLSIYLGSMIGLATTGFIGLDLFAAAGAPLAVGGWTVNGFVLLPHIGVALTGLVLGLGANPTHMVVKYVSESAAARRLANLPQPVALEEVVVPENHSTQPHEEVRLARFMGFSSVDELDLPLVETEGKRSIRMERGDLLSLLADSDIEVRMGASEVPARRIRPASMNLPRGR